LLEIWVQAICQDDQIFLENSSLFGRKPDMTSIRMPQKRGGGFGGSLREAIRRLMQNKAVWVCQLMEGIPDGRVYAGGSPGLYAPGGRFNRGNNPGMNFGDKIGYTRPNRAPSMPIAFNDPSFRMMEHPNL
jgi:hypothetical protein